MGKALLALPDQELHVTTLSLQSTAHVLRRALKELQRHLIVVGVEPIGVTDRAPPFLGFVGGQVRPRHHSLH